MADATIEIIPVVLDFDLIMGQDLTFGVTYAVDGVVDSMAGATLRMEVRPLDSPNRNIKIYVDGVEKLGHNDNLVVSDRADRDSCALALLTAYPGQ